MIRKKVTMVLAILFAVNLVAGCGNERNPALDSPAGSAARDNALLREYGLTARDGLRVRTDTERNRLWVLGLDHVRVYDTVKRTLIRKIALPAWSATSVTCPADIVVDQSGSALISSNVLARLVRIDAHGFELTVHDIRLLDKEHWDVGFSALVFGKDGTLFAATSASGTFWKIDLGTASARMVELNEPLENACVLALAAENHRQVSTGSTSICVGRDARKRMGISSDFARGRVEDAPCSLAQIRSGRAERRLMSMTVVR